MIIFYQVETKKSTAHPPTTMGCCGPKMAMVGVILSVWGILQLTALGIMFFFQAVLLLPDVVKPDQYYEDPDKFYQEVDDGYLKTAIRCWMTAGLYVLLLLFSMFKLRSSRIKMAQKKAQLKAMPRKSMTAVTSV